MKTIEKGEWRVGGGAVETIEKGTMETTKKGRKQWRPLGKEQWRSLRKEIGNHWGRSSGGHWGRRSTDHWGRNTSSLQGPRKIDTMQYGLLSHTLVKDEWFLATLYFQNKS